MGEKLGNSRTRFETVIWTVKLAFLFIGIISTFLLFKLAVPYSVNVFFSTLPRLWSCFRSWLSPPYLYIVVNFIIISIAASSSFQKKEISDQEKTKSNEEEEEEVEKVKQSENRLRRSLENDKTVSDSGREKPLLIESSSSSPSTWSESSCLTESAIATPEPRKPPVSARLSGKKTTDVHRRSDRPSLPVKSFGTSKPTKKQNDDDRSDSVNNSIDATWRAITEGQGKTMTKQLRKSDTWNAPPCVVVPEPEVSVLASSSKPELRKSETFHETASSSSVSSSGSSSGGRLSKEKSLSHDELNRRVESFIMKFKNDIRLQRQESYQRYLEMVNRGVY